MKFLVLLSLVAYCTCVPVTLSKHITVDVNVEHPEEKFDQSWQKPSYLNQFTEEPRYQQATHDFLNTWYQKYLQQYMPWAHTKETTYGADFPWSQYSYDREFEHLTPAQRFLNYLKSQKYNDVSDDDYLYRMFNQYLPEYVRENQLNYKQVSPILQKYFEHVPQKQLLDMHRTLQIPFIPVEFLQHALKGLHQHLGQAPYTREQIRDYIMKNVEYFPNHHVSQEELEQLIEFFQHMEFFMTYGFRKHDEQTMGYEKVEQLNPWARFFLNLKQNSVERQNQYHQVYQNWEQPQADHWTQYYQGKVPSAQEWRFPWSRDWSQRVNADHTEFPQQWSYFYQEKVPVEQEWRFPWSRDWTQRENADHTEFPQQWAHFYQEKVPSGQEWRFPWSRDWTQRVNADHTEFPQQWAHFYQEKVPAGQEWRFPWSHDWNHKVNVEQTELPQ